MYNLARWSSAFCPGFCSLCVPPVQPITHSTFLPTFGTEYPEPSVLTDRLRTWIKIIISNYLFYKFWFWTIQRIGKRLILHFRRQTRLLVRWRTRRPITPCGWGYFWNMWTHVFRVVSSAEFPSFSQTENHSSVIRQFPSSLCSRHAIRSCTHGTSTLMIPQQALLDPALQLPSSI